MRNESFDWNEDWEWIDLSDAKDYDPNHWDENLDWEKLREIYPIPGQSSLFPPDKDYFLNEEEKINNLNSSFEELIKATYTEEEFTPLWELAKAMDHFDG